jgi:L-arabinose transport system ATP-binding protein
LQALVLGMGIRENITLPVLDRFGSAFVPSRAGERAMVADSIQSLRIRTPHMEQRVSALSGGNQQKVVIARWLATKPKVLILDEPTRGIDVGAKVEVFETMNELARAGAAILMVSSELPELIQVADRILVMAGGRLTGELPGKTTQEEIMHLAAPLAENVRRTEDRN